MRAMSSCGTDKLHALLFEGARELENVRFFPGSDRGLTAAQLRAEAAAMIAAALAGPMVDNPPVTGRQKTSIDTLISDK
jgi:hypothetical protein